MASTHIKSKLSLNKTPVGIDYKNTSLLCHYDTSTTSYNGVESYKFEPDNDTLLFYPLTEGQGTIIRSKDSNQIPAKFNGTCTWSDNAMHGHSILVNSGSSYVNTSVNIETIISTYGGFTLEAIVKYNGAPYNNAEGNIWGSDGYNWGLLQIYNASGLQIRAALWESSSTVKVITSAALDSNMWHHIALTYNNTTKVMGLFVDGILVGTVTLAAGPWFSNNILKCGSSQNSWYSNVFIDSFSLYKGVRSTANIVRDANMSTEILTGMNQRLVKNGTGNITAGYDGKYGGALVVAEATKNVVPNPITFSSGWSSYSNGNDGSVMTEFGVEGLNIVNRQSWCGASKAITLPSTGTYTLSVKVKVLSRTNTAINATLYTSGGGIGDTNVSATWNEDDIDVWQTLTMTRTYTTTGITLFLICYGGVNDPAYKITAQYCMPQIELKSYNTYFVSGERPVDTYYRYPISVLNPAEGTVSFWFKYDSLVAFRGTNPILTNGGTEVANTAFDLLFGNATTYGRFYFRKYGSTSVQFVYDFTSDMSKQWTMITCTWKNGQYMRLYVNGVLMNSIAAPDFSTIAGDDFCIGGGFRVTPNFMIDELRVDKISQNDEEILSWYISQCPFYAKDRYKVVR